jgi:dihydroorotase
MQKYLIKDISVVNEGTISVRDVLIENGRISRIDGLVSAPAGTVVIDGTGRHLLPGVIDDQVHFREPGLTHKATIATESRAAVAGGVTSFMEMPNTKPAALTLDLLEEKYAIAAATSPANYSFFMGTSNDNIDEVLRVNDHRRDICGVKVFMGSSTGNMLVDNLLSIEKLFRESEVLIATHCEDERIIKNNLARLKAEKSQLEPADHPVIRDVDACFESSFMAVQIAHRYNTRLHILHISTARELQLFSNMLPLAEKRITCEVCVHHLHFTADDYATLGNRIKCNPAIKAPENRAGLWQALLDDTIDVIATDHAPHTWEEKQEDYEHAHAGLPLVQHSLPLMLHYHREGRISLEKIVQKMSHDVATCFQIRERGFIREGYHADLVIVDLNKPFTVARENILYKCGWSPLEGTTFPASVTHTFVSGRLAYAAGRIHEDIRGERMQFDR